MQVRLNGDLIESQMADELLCNRQAVIAKANQAR